MKCRHIVGAIATLRPNGGGVTLYYVHTDHLNTPRRVGRPSDSTVVWRWDADPFGAAAADQDPDGDSVTFVYGLRLPGQYYDKESGLHYNYMRDYDADTGRYIESDPIGIADGPNTYLYAKARPTGLTDAFGLMTDDQCCLRSQQLGQHENPNSIGWVVCCEGRKVACAYTPSTPRRGWDVLRKCILAHEQTHLSEIQCPNCTKDPERPAPSGPGYPGYNMSECRAGRVEMMCLRNSLASCGDDDACRTEVQRYISSKTRYYSKCWGGL
jgi:RHS repeat-associated protein